MLTLCALVRIALAQTHWATKLTDGVEIEVDEEAAVIEGELTTFITITKPVFPADLLQDIIFTTSMIRQETPSIGTAKVLSRLKIAEDFITIPISWWDTQQSRRGVVNGIGSAIKFLFGTATDSEMQEVRVILDEMRRDQDTTLHWIDQFTVTINHTYGEIQINRDHINLLFKEVKGILSELNNGLSGVLRQIRMVRNQQAVSELVTQSY